MGNSGSSPSAPTPKYTEGSIENSCGKPLTLIGKKIWVGAQISDPPTTIEHQGSVLIKQSADPGNVTTPGCVGAIAYKFNDGDKEIKWVIAWSNPVGSDGKVYTDILQEKFTWDQIKSELDERGKPEFQTNKFGYHIEISIPPYDSTGTATLKACIEQPLFF